MGGRYNHIGPFGACDFGWVVQYHGGWRLRRPNLKVKRERKDSMESKRYNVNSCLLGYFHCILLNHSPNFIK